MDDHYRLAPVLPGDAFVRSSDPGHWCITSYLIITPGWTLLLVPPFFDDSGPVDETFNVVTTGRRVSTATDLAMGDPSWADGMVRLPADHSDRGDEHR